MAISQAAQIHPSAKIAEGVNIGPWTLIGENVEIGEGTTVASHVVIEKNTRIGKNNTIAQFASLGGDPQHTGYRGEETWLEIGDHNIIREYVTFNRGTADGRTMTKIGNHNYFMAYTHVAHDCVIGDHVIFANTASVAGHVEVDNYAILGPFAGVHQFVRVGAYSFLGRATKVYQDILPFMLVTGNPAEHTGINVVGLRRHGFSMETVQTLKKARQLICRRGKKLVQIKEELQQLQMNAPEVGALLKVIETSKRGISR